MQYYTVCFFGHRWIDNLNLIEEKLAPIIRELIRTKPFVEFLIWRNGEFDEFAASIIKRVQHEEDLMNSELTLVLPYKVAGVEYYEKYYDNIIIPDVVGGAHPKRAITLRNRYMIDVSDLAIGLVERKGGAYTMMQYAKEKGVKIINIAL